MHVCVYVCACVFLVIKGGFRKKDKEAKNISSEFMGMFNELKKQFRSTYGLCKHIFSVSLCFQRSDMYSHNNVLF